MTSDDYHVTMSKKPTDMARIADFKAHLSAYLRRVRAGHPLTLYDRDTPVAQVVPIDRPPERLVIRKGTGRLEDVVLPPPLGIEVDSLAALLEERADRW